MKSELENVLRDGIHKNFNEYLLRRRTFLKKSSRKAVHKLRRQIRKMTSQLDLTGPLVAPKSSKRLQKLITRELKCLSGVRDYQVQLKRLEHPSKLIEPYKYERFLLKSEKQGIGNAKKRFRKCGCKNQIKALQRIDTKLTKRFSNASEKEKTKLLSKLRERFLSALSSAEHLQLDLRTGDHKTFHKFRIQVKDLVYKADAAEALLNFAPPFFRQINSLKKELGTLQDKVVFLRMAKGFFVKTKSHPHPENEIEKAILNNEKHIAQHPVKLH